MRKRSKQESKFRQLREALCRADADFSMALDRLGEAESTKDEKRRKAAKRGESETSDAADVAWRAFCRYKPTTVEELVEYIRVTLSHERIMSGTEIIDNDRDFVFSILTNTQAAILGFILPEEPF